MAVLSDDELVEGLLSWAGRVAAGEARVLTFLGEVDAREVWAQHGVRSCAHWLAWKLGVTLVTAREKVRVARALRDLPALAAELALGRVSYSQARAITRVATGADEQQWVELARVTTASQLEQAVRGVCRARHDQAEDPLALEQPREELRVSWDEDGSLLLAVRVSAAHAPAVLARIGQAQQAEQSDRDALYARLTADLTDTVATEGSPGPQRASAEASTPPFAEPYEYVEPPYPMPRQRVGSFAPPSEAELTAIAAWRVECERRRGRCEAARAWQDHVDREAVAREVPRRWASQGDGFLRALLRPEGLKPSTVQLLIDPVSGWARTCQGELLPPSTLRQVLKTLPGRGGRGALQVRPLTAADLARHDLGRTGRLVSPALRALLGQLDGERCRFPSCDRSRRLHAHHVRFWRDGGPTDLANLVLVCSRHHTLIHAEGFQLVLSPDRSLTVRTADDIPVPHHPTRPSGQPADLGQTAEGLSSDWANDPFDLGYVVQVMLQHSS